MNRMSVPFGLGVVMSWVELGMEQVNGNEAPKTGDAA